MMDQLPCGWKRLMTKSALILLLLLCLCACDSKEEHKAASQFTPPVTAARVTKQTVNVRLTAIGTVEASSTVEVKTRVDGQLMLVHFREGQEVKQGELLFTIDPAPYEAALKEASSRLASDKAQTQKALTDLQRYADLVKNKVISVADYEGYATAAKVRSSVQAATEAEVESAKLRLSWCYIHAPISGPTGALYFHAGNLVKANADKPLVVIQQVKPIAVSFTVPEQYLSVVRKFQALGNVPVEASIPGEAEPERGFINFVDNAVNTATGTIRLKSTFTNEQKRLWPGQFVNIGLTSTTLADAMLAPSSAVQTGPRGQYVFVLDDSLTVQMREVSVGPKLDNKFTVIDAGLKEGELLVTDGQLRLVPGIKVSVRNSQELGL